ncbi:arginase family protein [Arthrobacter sp. I2-34]|uniref:Arginase family protein n=2 Tax=Arthrobacter hankyongi TaxID=2904801 RepID=A0ABS9L5C0_9MICC|nr:arginase family protein [Arthrobacter hankyongi]
MGRSRCHPAGRRTTLDYRLIINQGRVADRTEGALAGARKAGLALAEHFSVEPTVVGQPSPAVQDDWRQALDQVEDTLRGLAGAVSSALDEGQVPLLVANTCAASIATLPVAAERYPEAVVLWIDAHGDFNTPASTESGYLGGMALAGACGLWDSGHGGIVYPRNAILVGARASTPRRWHCFSTPASPSCHRNRPLPRRCWSL